jgi:predicted ATPase
MTTEVVTFGREAELRRLADALEQAYGGRPRAAFFEGAPGIGKTALLEEFRVRSTRRYPDLRIHLIRPPAQPPYRPVRQAVEQVTSGSRLARLGGRQRIVREARELLPDWLGAIPGVGDLIAATFATADAIYRRRRGNGRAPAVEIDGDVGVLLRAGRKRPVALLLDGLEQLEREDAECLETLLRTRSCERLLIVGTYRPAAPRAPARPVDRLLASLPAGTFTAHRLEGLAAGAVSAWLAARFPTSTIPTELQSRLVATTGGHPAMVAAAFAQLEERAAPRQAGRRRALDTAAQTLAPPVATDALADLSALGPALIEAVSAASVLGDRFDACALARLLARDEVEVEDQLALGIHFGVLQLAGERTLADGEMTTVYRFTDPHLCAALRGALVPERRQALERVRQEQASS